MSPPYWLRWGVFAGAVLIVALTVDNQYYYTLINFIGIHAMLVVGLNLLLGYAGQISLGHAAFFGLGAYTSGILTATYGVNPWLALPAGLAVSGVAAVIIGVPALKLRGYYLAMATLGFGIIVFIVLKEARGLTGGPSGLTDIPSLRIGSFSFNTPWRLFLLIWPLLGVLLAVSANIVDSRVGRALRALHDSEAAAQSLGVNVPRLKLLIFVWSALYASLAGSLYAHTLNFIAPASFGFMFSIKLVTMVVVGGLASIWGSLLGAAVLTVLPEALGYLGVSLEALLSAMGLPAPPELMSLCHDLEVVIFGGILMGVMIFLPRGLVRGVMDLLEFRRYKREGGALPFN
jgi:branched-chain amino acid transport system permease protein